MKQIVNNFFKKTKETMILNFKNIVNILKLNQYYTIENTGNSNCIVGNNNNFKCVKYTNTIVNEKIKRFT